MFNYREIGSTAEDQLPSGYRHIRRRKVIGQGRACFGDAGDRVMRWGMQHGAGLRVRASTPQAQPGSVVTLSWGPVSGACGVVYVVDQPERRGFAYGTIEGHPESGEEYFGVSYDPSADTVYAEVTAFSRPGRWWSRAAAPLALLVQTRITNRYLAALARPA